MVSNGNEELGTVVQNSPIPDSVSGESNSSQGTEGSGEEQDPNTRFVTNVLYENNGSVYGFEILLFDTSNKKIKSIMVVDETDFDSWTEMISKLKDAYAFYTEQDASNLELIKTEKAKIGNKGYKSNPDEVYTVEDYENFMSELEWSSLKELGSLENILKNSYNSTINNYPVEINATKFMGMTSDEFSKAGHSHNFAEKSHSSTENEYGLGNDAVYGHTKVVNNFNTKEYHAGESLSSYQGAILDNRVKELETKETWSKVISRADGFLRYRVLKDLRLIICTYNRADYTGLKDKTGSHPLHKKGTIDEKYAPSSRVITPLYRGDVTVSLNTDGSINIYNLTKINKMNINFQVIWKY